MTKKLFAFCLLLMTRNLLQILVKKLMSLILFLQDSAQLLKLTVFSIHKLIPLLIRTCQILNSQICKLDPNKSHGYDMISVRMLKKSGDAIIKLLFTIFKNCLKCRTFPDGWKKWKVVSIFKKGNKQNIKNYCPVSLLPICRKTIF